MKRRTIEKLVVATVVCLAFPFAALAEDSPLPAGFEAQPLIKTGLSRDNEPITYPTGKPEIIAVIGTLAKDGRTALQ